MKRADLEIQFQKQINMNENLKDDGYTFVSAQSRLTRILNAYTDIEKAFIYLTDRIEVLDDAQQDLLHYIEFKDLNTRDSYKYLKQLQSIRIERRLVKNELESMEVANEAIKNIKDALYHIRKAQSTCSKIEDKDREYRNRRPIETGITNEMFEQAKCKYDEKLKGMVKRR